MKTDFDSLRIRIKENDVSALEETCRAAFIPLVRYASQITGSVPLAEEVVQDLLLKIWQTRAELIAAGSFKAYLFKAVHNQSLNALRHKNSQKESVNQLNSEKKWEFISETYDSNDNFIEKIFSDETEDLIKSVIQELPEQCRNVFLISRYSDLDNKDISEKLNLSVHTVRSHIYHALKKISAALNKEK